MADEVDLSHMFREINYRIKEAKPALATFAADQTIPLDVRWSLWRKAPHSLKEDGGWIQEIPELQQAGLYDHYGLFNDYERHRVLSAEDIVEHLLENQPKPDDLVRDEVIRRSGEIGLKKLREAGEMVYPHRITDAMIAATKEYFLSRNMGSFTWDW